MRLKNIFLHSLFSAILVYSSASFAYAQIDYIWPISDSEKYGKFINSSFAEYRPDRFHAGIDIKTIWRDGHRVIAIDDGFLYRMRISPFGYGRSIYIRLKDGNIAVYGHLRLFGKKFQAIAEDEQVKLNKYSVDLWFGQNEIPVIKGEVLGITGRSGTRLQHLHFELRDSNNNPINPLANGLSDKDESAPRPTKISIRPLNINSYVENDWTPEILPLNNGRDGVFTLSKPVKVWGDIGLSIESYDRNGTYENNFSIYSLKLLVGGEEVFSALYDKYNYSQNKIVNLDRDYRLMRRDKGRFQKLYIEENNNLSFYGNYKPGDGILHFDKTETGTVPFEIIVGDYSGNKTSVRGEFELIEYDNNQIFPAESPLADNEITGKEKVQRIPLSNIFEVFDVIEDFQDDYLRLYFTAAEDLELLPEVTLEREDAATISLPVHAQSRRSFSSVLPLSEIDNRSAKIYFEGVSESHSYRTEVSTMVYKIPKRGGYLDLPDNSGRISVVNGNLYNDIWLRQKIVKKLDQNSGIDFVGSIVNLEPKEIFLQSNVRLTLNYPPDDPKPDKLGIYARDNDGDWHYIGHNRNAAANSITIGLSSLEIVSVIRDTVPPDIWRIAPENNASVTNGKVEIAAWFVDELSGIAGEDKMGFFLDNKKQIAEWDPILKKIFVKPKQSLISGIHTVRFFVTDNMNNTAERTWSFEVK